MQRCVGSRLGCECGELELSGCGVGKGGKPERGGALAYAAGGSGLGGECGEVVDSTSNAAHR